MLFKILKKDLIRRKGVNIILFLFITLATVFLSSSVNNILVISKAVDYFMEYASVPDINLITAGEEEKDKIMKWAKQEKFISDYDYERLLSISGKSVTIKKGKKETPFDIKGDGVYMGTAKASYNKVFDLNGETFTLEKGEMGVSKSLMEKNKIKVGDKIVVTNNGLKKEFVIKVAVKDAAFGNDMVGMTRFIVEQEDFELFSEKAEKVGLFYFMTENIERVNKDLNEKEFKTTLNTVEGSIYKMVYSFDMVMAALLILVGICLILISLLVLRFTLVFTMEEDYQEIGIMKAVGFRGFAIKKIYLVKYFAIVSVGAFLGFIFSVPISDIMVSAVNENMVMEKSSANISSNIICACSVIIIVLLFCYFCTKKLNKVSAITAIRRGQNGERFTKRRGICLHTKKRMPVFMFLGVNDMVSHAKRYMVLLITFCISFILITIPLNTLNTMHSGEMVRKFYLDPDSAVNVRKIEGSTLNKSKTRDELIKNMKRVEQELKEEGYDAKLTGLPIFFIKYSEKGKNEKNNIMTIQALGPNTQVGDYEDGKAPMLSNEIAFSKTILEKYNWKLGDSIEAEVGGKKQSFIITGSYSDYMQLGSSARLSPELDTGSETVFDNWNVMVDMETDKSQKEMAKELSKKFPDYEWNDSQTLVNQNVGGIRESLDQIKIPMTGMLCIIIMMITILMEKLFIVREKGEIAMMKSVGFQNKDIRSWQIMRMVCVVVSSMVAAIPLSLLSNQFMLKPIFAIMGADVKIQVVPWQVYGVYPGVLLLGIVIATIFATRSVRKINIQELNNLE